ncbi:aldehyde dehydrogenase [Devosia sp. Root436]|uniref:aldehyde dehydrogenase family protein n=1 Tax=Devosia sp. Root436 TaxID=1736537 RepID=UPI0007020509|nr:aldehyde dehydrogenase family protein [Devosia sp. Root436]KQX42532.1 aldehyde dehydrogenase [Devosia sp. Root436]
MNELYSWAPSPGAGHFIDGRFVTPASGAYIDCLDPANGQVVMRIARGGSLDVEHAVASAAEGFKAWQAVKPYRRGQALTRVAFLLREHAERLAQIETLDTGHPITRSRRDIETSARYFEFYAGIADKIHGEVIPADLDYLTYTQREPFGVTAQIVPWNAPLHQLARGVAPSLAAGNAVVAKPSELTSGTALELARLIIDAGMPPGLLNVVTGFGAEVGQPLCEHDAVRQITFTGSVETGRAIMAIAARRIIPVTTELGGKSPFIVCDDADLAVAAKAAVPALFTLSGQTCSAGTRFLVQRSIVEEFTARFIAETRATVTVGPGKEDRMMGPLASEQQLAMALHYVEAGRSEGATLAMGGARLGGELSGGYFMEPTLFTNARNDMKIAREEIFGPVGVIIPFDDDAEALHMANDSEFGLVAGIWTRDFPRARRFANALECGQVFINNYRGVGLEAPFGGYKHSGLGREKGLEGLRSYLQTKTIIAQG